VQVRLLLHPAGVGEAQPGAPQERGEVDVAERRQQVHLRGQGLVQPLALERRAGPRVERQHQRLVERGERPGQLAERRLDGVALPVHGGHQVPAGLEPERLGIRRVLGRRRADEPGHVDHHVPDHVDAVADAFAIEVLRRHLGGTEEERRELVGQHAVDLLGHAPVERAQPGLDVGHRDPQLGRRQGRCKGAVGVPVDQHPLGLHLAQDALDADQDPPGLLGVGAGAGLEPQVGLGQPELVVEHLGQLVVVVLAGVQRYQLDPALQRGVERRGLDELGPVAGDREEPHTSMV
jgi:hypothetical protein